MGHDQYSDRCDPAGWRISLLSQLYVLLQLLYVSPQFLIECHWCHSIVLSVFTNQHVYLGWFTTFTRISSEVRVEPSVQGIPFSHILLLRLQYLSCLCTLGPTCGRIQTLREAPLLGASSSLNTERCTNILHWSMLIASCGGSYVCFVDRCGVLVCVGKVVTCTGQI